MGDRTASTTTAEFIQVNSLSIATRERARTLDGQWLVINGEGALACFGGQQFKVTAVGVALAELRPGIEARRRRHARGGRRADGHERCTTAGQLPINLGAADDDYLGRAHVTAQPCTGYQLHDHLHTTQ